MSIPLAPSPPDPHALGRTGSSARSIHIASLSRFCIPAFMQCSLQLPLSAADPHASGRSPSTVRSARTATLPAITTAAIAVSVPFSPSITGPHASGRIIACVPCTNTASLCYRSFRKSGVCLTHASFQQSPGLLHSLPIPFLCSFLALSVVMLAHASLNNSFVRSIHTAQLFNGKCFVPFVR